MRRTIARLFRAVAAAIDPVPIAPAVPADTEPGPEMQRARQICDEMLLRNALYQALNRYQPTRPIGQA